MTLVLFFIAQGLVGVLLGAYLTRRKTMESLYLAGCDKKNVSHLQYVEFHLLDVPFPTKPGNTEETKVIILRIFTIHGTVEVYLNTDDAPRIAAWFAEAGITVDDPVEIESELQGVAD